MRIILFTGRGGSGVSTVSAATAVAIANAGQRTLAFGLGSGLGDALALPLTHEAREIAPNLSVLETRHGDDEPDEFRDWLEDLLEWRGIEPELADDLAALPGANQIGRMLNLARHVEDGGYDAVIVDGLPLEQFLDIPPSLDAAARWLERLFEPRQSNVFEPFVRMFAADYAEAGEEMLESGRELLGRLADLRDLLTDPGVASVRVVLRPDATAAADTRELLTALNLFAYPCDALVLNRMLPDKVQDPFFAEMRSEQAAALTETRAAAGELPVLTGALAQSSSPGIDALGPLADALYGDRTPADVLHRADAHVFTRRDGAYVMSLTLPFAEKKDLAVEQLDDGVAVHLNGRRAVLMLPPEIENTEASSWSFEPPELKINFAG
jgi:arsenite/tail-anchored protein-transporting ATPase